MEAKASFRGTGISKFLIVVVGVCVAVGLGAMAATISTKINAPAAGHATSGVVQAANSFVGPDAQDRNSQLAATRLTKAYHQLNTRSVIQAATSSLGPDALDRNSQLAADRLPKPAAAPRTRIPVGYF